MLETLNFTIHIGNTPTFSYFDLYIIYTVMYIQYYIIWLKKILISLYYLVSVNLSICLK